MTTLTLKKRLALELVTLGLLTALFLLLFPHRPIYLDIALALIALTLLAFNGQVSAFVEHFFDVDMTKSQRSLNSYD
jgi:hypothetical protein